MSFYFMGLASVCTLTYSIISMVSLLLNELLYFLILFLLFYLIRGRLNLKIKKSGLMGICAFLVSTHFMLSFTFAVLSIKDIWFPYFLDFDDPFLKPRYNFDFGNLFNLLLILALPNIIAFLWGLIKVVLILFGPRSGEGST